MSSGGLALYYKNQWRRPEQASGEGCWGPPPQGWGTRSMALRLGILGLSDFTILRFPGNFFQVSFFFGILFFGSSHFRDSQ